METENRLRDYLKRATVELTEARRRLAELEQTGTEPVAVVGLSCRYPGGADTPDELWRLLRDGRDAAVEVPESRWNFEDFLPPEGPAAQSIYSKRGALLDDIAGWDAGFFGCSPQEALRMDPQQRLLMELAWEGMEDAGLDPGGLAGSRTGVLVGLMDSTQYGRMQLSSLGADVGADPYFAQGTSSSVAAGRLAYHYDLRGPTLTVDSACSSSLVAVHLAIEALRRGECDTALAAGVALTMHPDMFVQGCVTSMFAPDGRCKTFDAAADGYLVGEGAGLVVLTRLSTALEKGYRVRAVLRGSAVNQDGRSNGLTAPNRTAQVEVIRRALDDAGVAPGEVDYIEAHGSGTGLGDAIELSALHDVFGGTGRAGHPLRVGAVKTNLGHTMSAAGVAGLIKTVLVLENRVVPPNVHQSEPSDAVPSDGTVRPVTGEWSLPDDREVRAGVSSFGWSGTNAHVVVETAPEASGQHHESGVDAGDGPAQVLPVSARSPEALRDQLTRLGNHLADGGPALVDVARTLQDGRARHAERRAVVAADAAGAAAALAAAASGPEGTAPAGATRVAFLLPGTGDQYAGMGRALYDTEPVYAAAVDECVRIAHERCGIDLRPSLFSEPAAGAGDLAALLGRGPGADGAGEDPLRHAETAHPFLFTVQYATAELLRHWGIEPDVLVGYSLGEYVAACLSGVFTLEDAMHLVVERARLIEAAPPGLMLAVAADEATVRAHVGADAGVDLAAFNGPYMTVLSGEAGEVHAAMAQLQDGDVACQLLRTEHAFHSSLLEPARDKLGELLAEVGRTAPRIPIVSNSTGRLLRDDQAVGSDYWTAHMVNPIRFADSVRTCLDEGVTVFLELGPGQLLGGLVRQNLTPSTGARTLGTLPPLWTSGERPDVRGELLGSCARLWESGVDVEWSRTRHGAGRIVSLPTYAFQRSRYWPEVGRRAAARPAAPVADEPREVGYRSTWNRDVTEPPAGTALPGTLVVFSDADGIGSALAARAAADGTRVVEVVAGDRREDDGARMVVDPAVPEHMTDVATAVAGAAGDGPVHLVHLWSLLDEGSGDLSHRLRCGYHSLMHAVQTFGEQPDVRLLTVSRGAATIIGGDAPAPHRAAVHGLGRSVRHEYPGLTWSGVDLDPDGTDASAAAAALADELRRDRTDPRGVLAGVRRGRRWTEDWTELPAPDTSADEVASPWRADGVYLITGGTRGLGMGLARHLVRAGVRKLTLVGRTSLADGEPGSAAAASAADVADLESAGAEVLTLTADTGDPEVLRAALRTCREHFGALDGIVHAAGAPASGVLARQTAASSTAVLAPKVAAMEPLAELVGPDSPPELRPELLVLYSSAIVAFGGIGESDYCAANTALAAYADALADTAPSTTVLSVSWAHWQHDAWQRTAAEQGSELATRADEYRARYGFTEEGGCAFLDHLIRTGAGSTAAFRQPLAEIAREWTAVLDLDSLVDAAATEAAERFPRPQLRTGFVPARTATEILVAEVWQSYLGIDEVGVHDPFFDLGGNSLVGMAVVRAVAKQLDTTIAPAVLFEHPTVAAFAAAVGDAGPDRQDETRQRLADSSARGRRRLRARTTNRRGDRRG
ncbi:type I polyketide synthase [Pseudonocardia endophytica]|uniref:Acyl transferase domain-containing protein n=1 Tax=Pseudonocardia endophytica TaxID=401976 RepID=A0A4R1HMK8_PSEEN|nr:type I polyketide synthase [Pseudonocardia endophytica]TCK22283.1 acyl transferase domain-containing protein [Pseudonocardia endophytica]